MAEADPSSLGAAARLRERFSPETAAWALTQVELRRRGLRKFANAEQMLFTRTGLEQATRPDVAQWRARCLAAAGVRHVVDLGCGIGSDAMACAAVGLEVSAVEMDPETLACATANLALVGSGPAVLGAAEDFEIPDGAAVFLDPARRNATGRSWEIADFSPSWDFVRAQLDSSRQVVVKLGPGFDKQHIPPGLQACWVSHNGDVVEVSLWNRFSPEGPHAVVMRRDASPVTLGPDGPRVPLEIAPLGRYILEPDNAVIRAGLIDAVAPGAHRWLLADHVAYLSSDEAIESPLATTFEVLEVFPFDVRILRGALRDRGVGAVEIKVRAMQVDPSRLRRQLKLRGSNQVTLILVRAVGGARAALVRRR